MKTIRIFIKKSLNKDRNLFPFSVNALNQFIYYHFNYYHIQFQYQYIYLFQVVSPLKILKP